MIGWPIDDERLAVVCANDAAEIRKEARFQIRVEHWSPVFRAENNVRQQMGERVRHKSKLRNRLVCFSHGVARDSSPQRQLNKSAERFLCQPRSGVR